MFFACLASTEIKMFSGTGCCLFENRHDLLPVQAFGRHKVRAICATQFSKASEAYRAPKHDQIVKSRHCNLFVAAQSFQTFDIEDAASLAGRRYQLFRFNRDPKHPGDGDHRRLTATLTRLVEQQTTSFQYDRGGARTTEIRPLVQKGGFWRFQHSKLARLQQEISKFLSYGNNGAYSLARNEQDWRKQRL